MNMLKKLEFDNITIPGHEIRQLGILEMEGETIVTQCPRAHQDNFTYVLSKLGSIVRPSNTFIIAFTCHSSNGLRLQILEKQDTITEVTQNCFFHQNVKI